MDNPSPPLARAELALQVTENPIFQQAVTDMREAFLQMWKDSEKRKMTQDGGIEIREECWRYVMFLDQFVATLQGYIEVGKAQGQAQKVDLP